MPDALVERNGHTMVITMNRPKRYNALTGAMLVRMYSFIRVAIGELDWSRVVWHVGQTISASRSA